MIRLVVRGTQAETDLYGKAGGVLVELALGTHAALKELSRVTGNDVPTLADALCAAVRQAAKRDQPVDASAKPQKRREKGNVTSKGHKRNA